MNIFNDKNAFSYKLIDWYTKNKRELPWRDLTDPYKIWISEIILQQTRVNQGISYYLRFVERFPKVDTLAGAHEDEVLKYWQGLGYYSRARNLHKAAKRVMSDFDGTFPTNYTDVKSLAGIGDYTAAAICSFAYNQPYAVVDGNVYRFLSRLFGIDKPIDSGSGKKYFAELAQDLLPSADSTQYNQAMMEFGALQCVPGMPDCSQCPFMDVCVAFARNTITKLPVKQQKTKVRNRFFNYLFITDGEHTFLQKRTEKDVWQNLYEFPLIETRHLPSVEELVQSAEFQAIFKNYPEAEIIKTTNPMKHVLSHRVIYAQFITIRIKSSDNETPAGIIRIPLNVIDNYAVSRLTELFLERME